MDKMRKQHIKIYLMDKNHFVIAKQNHMNIVFLLPQFQNFMTKSIIKSI